VSGVFSRVLRLVACSVLPSRQYFRLLARRIGNFENEVRLLPLLCEPDKAAIDVGASNGSYVTHMLAWYDCCYAFEPRADALAYLQQRLARAAGNRLHTEAVALSDRDGRTTLRVLDKEPGRSSVQGSNPLESLGGISERVVPMRRLDSYTGIRPAGLLKIDVEGHEAAVLRGAERLLTEQQPALIIEIEERHCPGSIHTVTNMLAGLGYQGHFLRGNLLEPIAAFDARRDQRCTADGQPETGGTYINNFVFLTAAQHAALRTACATHPQLNLGLAA
jgi:FkbM family methyltransferase